METPLNILFILPYDRVYRYKNAFSRSITYAPLTFPALAALIPPGIKTHITVIDEGVEKGKYDKLRPDIVALTATTSSSPRAYELCRYFKEKNSYTILGGHHATLMPDEAALHADSVFVGSAEQTFPAFMRDYTAGIPKKLYQPDGRDLTAAPPPDRSLIKTKNYLSQPAVIANYGCKNKCRYCVINSFWGGKDIERSIDAVIEEIKALGKKEIIFYDPNQTCDREYAIQLYIRLKTLNVKWASLTQIDAAFDEELLRLMAESGCIGVLIGFETFNQTGLDTVNKRIQVETYRDAVAAFHRYNISVLGTFMLGLDGDTTETLKKIPDLIDEIQVDLPRFAIMTPYPNTPFFAELDRQGRILTKNWGLYDGVHCVHAPTTIMPAEVEQLLADVKNKQKTSNHHRKSVILSAQA